MIESSLNTDQFELNKLDSLSNTIFGVAMTLLAYDLPKASEFTKVPEWTDLYHVYGARLSAMVVSFIVAGVFWMSHHRRLMMKPLGSRGIVLLNLLFLLSIILLPVTNGLNGSFGMTQVVAVVYGLHLIVIAGLNAWLWRLATGPGMHVELVAAAFPLLVFVPGTIVAALAPRYAIYFWVLGFGALLVRRLLSPRAAV
ncbi:MAG: DUF1211 domain-containing protein [Bradyrhizobium sp.]|uniref:TMEM175 family protein n=1 Tax=Bradyrhizobium sp. TaxID=376 RepID=UPI001D6FAE99|nr:TMEM175 family protein [Bradyrhizobium sp.]MBV9566256.1 DUF1211 domain-containing protein [Bradyrhizobium sp.]